MLQWDFYFSFGYLPLHHNNVNKLISTFTFTFSVTHFKSTQLLFWTLALLDLSFLLLLSDCSVYFGSPLCLFICSLYLCAPTTYITAFQVLFSNTYESGLCLFITNLCSRAAYLHSLIWAVLILCLLNWKLNN